MWTHPNRHHNRYVFCALAAILLACATAPAAVAPKPPAAPAPLPHTAAEMEAAHGKDAVAIKDDLLKAGPSIPSAYAVYCQRLGEEFLPVLGSANPEARLNTAILFAELGSLNCDRVLMKMLENPDPSVRYWAAKGLQTLAPKEKLVGPASVIKALKAARAVEKSPEVLAQLDLALAAYR